MAPRFKVKVLQTSKLLKNIAVITVVSLSFFLILFSKSDLFIINGIKHISSSVVNPVSNIISSPIRILSNLVNGYQFIFLFNQI